MLDIRAARHRAVLRAIETGQMPNLDLIHTMQRSQGYQPCFGRTREHCHQTVCRWHQECMALAGFVSTAKPPISAAAAGAFRQLRRPVAGTYRDGSTASGGPQVSTEEQVIRNESAPAASRDRFCNDSLTHIGV